MQANTLYNEFQHTPNHLPVKSLQVQTLDKWGPAISSGTFLLLKNESLIRKAVTLHGHSGNSSPHMSIHIELYKQPTHTSHSNHRPRAGTTSWHTHSPWPDSQLYNHKLPTR